MPDENSNSFPAFPVGSQLPGVDAIIGHWFAAGEVQIVFADEDNRQFILPKESLDLQTGSCERFYGRFLDPGQVWARRDPPTPLQGEARDREILKAYHEAGHA